MLIRLILTYAQPYTDAVRPVLALQLATTLAALPLPTLNAEIIDRDVATGNTALTVRTGGWMLVSVRQNAASVRASARTPMGMGRDLRAVVPHRVGTFSSREVAQFGGAGARWRQRVWRQADGPGCPPPDTDLL